MLWDFMLYQRTVEAERKAGEARIDARSASSDVHAVRDDLQRLLLLNRAMWELLRERTGCTDDDLMRKVTELDLQDGVRDGKLAVARRSCTACGRPLSRRHSRCMYCGAVDAGASPFPGAG